MALLMAGIPYGGAFVVALALYTTMPLFVFLREGGWPSYPRKAFRLYVLRVFWYTQLALPLVAGAGFIGMAIGAAFGAPLAGGRIGATIIAVPLGIFVAGGELGAGPLLVRLLVSRPPDSP